MKWKLGQSAFISIPVCKDVNVIVDADKLIFVHIQKTGGSAITKALGHEEHDPHKHRLATELRDLTGPELWDASYKIAFVRNPWDRLVSWWSMINGNRAAFTAGALVNSFFSYVLTHATTFEAFVKNCQDEIFDSDGRKHIFRNQLDYISDHDGTLMVDFIGRFESLQQDFNVVTQKLYGRDIELEHVNVSRHGHYSDFYTPELVSIVAEAYARDIAYFGYEFEARR